jgi:uncharacterized radical SAM protein YgiQ
MSHKFLPISQNDLRSRGWNELDIILVTGDAYVDHPSYAAVLIGRVLEDAGYKVGIIAQPDWHSDADFKKLGKPRLFFGVTAGNLDSMVANYTANKLPRSSDDYSPGGKARMRPDRAVIMYTNRIKQAYAGVPVVIGGIEASCRRLAHYDYWSEKVRRSILTDSKADILVYGMGEKQAVEIAKRIESGGSLDGIKGTAVFRAGCGQLKDAVTIPSFEDVSSSKEKFNEAFIAAYNEADPVRGKTIVQPHDKRYLIQYPPAEPMSEAELDNIYGLPFARNWHPLYDKDKGVPGFETVRWSVTSHRGCPGACNFCSLFFHQGRIVQSRSAESILKEIRLIALSRAFKGTITDIGGPTANLYNASCELWKKNGACHIKKCLVPRKCENLKIGYGRTINIWREALKVPNVKHVFVGSGVRYDLLVYKEAAEYLKELCKNHVSGYLKVAPEHTEEHVLRLMNKCDFSSYSQFAGKFNAINKQMGKKQFLVNYLIIAHPGSTLKDALKMSETLKSMRIYPEQVQDFLPLPMTASGAMYCTGIDPFTGKSVYVARNMRERKMHRALVQYKEDANQKYIREAVDMLGGSKSKGDGHGNKDRKTNGRRA